MNPVSKEGNMKKKFLTLGLASIFLITLSISCPSGENGEPPPQEVNYQICCWNLEHFSPTAKRGFPEVLPRIDPRTEEQLDEIKAEIYLFSEIENEAYLASFVQKIGADWKYNIGISGSNQKTAFVWNPNAVKVIKGGDFVITDTFTASGREREIFDREPQLLHIVFLDSDGNERNDILLIGFHMLSGERWNKQRQKGM